MRRKEVIALNEGIILEKFLEVADNRRSIKMLVAGFGEMIFFANDIFQTTVSETEMFCLPVSKKLVDVDLLSNQHDSLKLNNNRQH